MSDQTCGGFTLQLRSTRIRLASAVTAVLAVTALGAGTLAAAPAAFAATSAPSGQADATFPPYPEGSSLAGAGTSGFFTYDYDSVDRITDLVWTPYDGGASKRFRHPKNGGYALAGNDVAVVGDDSWPEAMQSITLWNMADPAAPGVDIDLGALGGGYLATLSPTSVLAQITNTDGTAELRVVTKDGATTTTRKITGLPADATEFSGSTVLGGSVLVRYAAGPPDARTGHRALIDVAAGTVTETYSSAKSGYNNDSGHLTFSASHVAWLDQTDNNEVYVTSVDRKTGEEKKTDLGYSSDEWYYELVGDWLVYGAYWAPAKAVSLTTGETRDLGVTGPESAPSSDGSAVLRGSRDADGDGLFRVAAGTDGTLTVTKVAETVTPVTPLEIQQVRVPDTAELDKTGGKVTLGWTLSRADAYLDVTLTHIATGKEFTKRVTAPATDTLFSFDWDGVIAGVDAPNGTYAVEAEATPLDGIGEPAYQGWKMNVVRTADPHDYTDNGSTDVLARDASGVLWRDDLRDRPVNGQVKSAQRAKIGSGWGVYKQIEAVGNVGGAAPGDLIAVDGSGVQWLYLGKGDGTFAPRVKVGTGWQIYNKIAGGSDLDGDGRPDLVATDGAGALWFYKGTGSYAKPYAPRVSLGGNWQGYNQLTAVGNIAGTAAGDMVARDTSGTLWLYQGNGTGGFAPRVKIGGGWGAYSQLVGAGDLDNDGRRDLIAYGSAGTYVYRSTGTITVPFARQSTTLYAGEGSKFNNVL
ncbi:VCBS repeat protein [Streptomyces sp. PanSC19]|uniref:FG-GAP repeat domain-containing protein n=1 Tax=Streptomyces sp. PanSC19 TaxID=1520455 RepID=UPI000FAD2BFE|nr:VCBS repeat-containing protein [Streptomyces sp. PanSC19]ROQ26047.1 VCBS repeat protein [Streptomyces sp. PanSC19]